MYLIVNLIGACKGRKFIRKTWSWAGDTDLFKDHSYNPLFQIFEKYAVICIQASKHTVYIQIQYSTVCIGLKNHSYNHPPII